jgi:hypothetical protein
MIMAANLSVSGIGPTLGSIRAFLDVSSLKLAPGTVSAAPGVFSGMVAPLQMLGGLAKGALVDVKLECEAPSVTSSASMYGDTAWKIPRKKITESFSFQTKRFPECLAL